MNHLDEETIMEVIADMINSGTLEGFETEDQMHIIELMTEAIKKYHGKELNKFLNGLHINYTRDKKLSNL